MIPISDDVRTILSSRLKLGEQARPFCRVEVDRLAFVPGRTEQLTYVTMGSKEATNVQQSWIEDPGGGAYGGYTVTNYLTAVFPIKTITYQTATITSPFGMRNGSQHRGVDIAVPVGEEVVAAWAGKVVNITRNRTTGAGFSIDLKHQSGLKTRYLHLSQIGVLLGQEVLQGQVIGKSGNTGDVWTSNHPVTEAERDAGKGAHLHFEVWTGCDQESSTAAGGSPVDPEVYLKGDRNIYTDSSNVGAGVNLGSTKTGYAGANKLSEKFDQRDWYDIPIYSTSPNLSAISSVQRGWTLFDSGGKQVYEFISGQEETNSTIGIKLDILNIQDAMFSMGFGSNFNGEQGDYLVIKLDDQILQRVLTFSGATTVQEIKGVFIPSGSRLLTVEINWGGVIELDNGVPIKKIMALDYMKIQELLPLPYSQGKDIGALDSSKEVNHIDEVDLDNFVFNTKPERINLQVGSFVYMDTLVLPNVIRIEHDDQIEAESREMQITISNPGGYFSPDYSPYYFPDMKDLSSPWSYYVNGFHVGILGENTPIRVYLGYGQQEFRIFTGLIDKTDINGDSTLTITCRDMYKKIAEKVLLEKKQYPDLDHSDNDSEGDTVEVEQKPYWVKSTIVLDLIKYAGMVGWRVCADDLAYPDFVIEETYLTEIDQNTGLAVIPIPGREGEFEAKPIDSILTPNGWMNPFVEEYGKLFEAFKYKVGDAINEVIKDINFRSYCDRYGTYRLESIDYFKPIVASFTSEDNLIQITKSIDWSRGRSHIIIFDDLDKRADFLDKEVLLELKGEIRTLVVNAPWARTLEAKKAVAERAFLDMKRMCRTIQVSIPANPTLELMDRVMIYDKRTSTSSVYTIKGIRTTYSDGGAFQVIDLLWSMEGTVV